MTPGVHLLISWLSTVEVLRNRRERIVVAFSGVAPDLDGLGIIVDKITGTTNYYQNFHHYFGHSIVSAFVISAIAMLLAKSQRKLVWLMSFMLVHVHILCDIIGSKGPDGYHWPIYYLYPFNSKFKLTWEYQWELNAWPNLMILFLLICGCVYYGSSKKLTVLEVFSRRLDSAAQNMYGKYVRKNS